MLGEYLDEFIIIYLDNIIIYLDNKKLAEYVLWDYKINLKLGIILKFFLIYKLMEIENLALREFVKENLKKRIYLTIIVISRISSIIYTKEKRKIKNVY